MSDDKVTVHPKRKPPEDSVPFIPPYFRFDYGFRAGISLMCFRIDCDSTHVVERGTALTELVAIALEHVKEKHGG